MEESRPHSLIIVLTTQTALTIVEIAAHKLDFHLVDMLEQGVGYLFMFFDSDEILARFLRRVSMILASEHG